MSEIEILSVASEMFPLGPAGSVGETTAGLAAALAEHGFLARTLLPGFPHVLASLDEAEPIHQFADLFGAPARLVSATAAGLELFVIEAPHLYGRAIDVSGDTGGNRDLAAVQFAALGRVAADLACGAVARYRPALVHCHDWQAGLAPAYLTFVHRARPPTVMTVYDPASAGLFPAALLDRIGLPPGCFDVDGVEFYGRIGFLKAGLRLADRITTISPSDAEAMRTPERGMGLDGLLRSRAHETLGILNGIDIGVWNPATDARLAHPFNLTRLGGRPDNKAALQRRFGLDEDPNALLLAADALGPIPDWVCSALPIVVEQGGEVVVLVTDGSRQHHHVLDSLGRVAWVRGGQDLLRESLGGVDAVLLPSGGAASLANAMRALRYGAVPLVVEASGPADCIVDANAAAVAAGVATGVTFASPTLQALERAIGRLSALFADPEVWQTLQRNGMKADVSWRAPARRYAALYRELIEARRA